MGRVAVMLLLLALIKDAVASDIDRVLDRRSLVQVRTLDGLPRDVNALLGQGKGGPDGIADRGQPFNKTDVVDSRLPMRRFIVGGSSLSAVLVAYEQGGRGSSVQALGFVLEPSGWKQIGQWTLKSTPYTLFGLIELIAPSRSSLMLDQQVSASGSRPVRRDGPMRAENINAEEVRETQSVMSSVLPGAIVNISAVVSGCPCEDGPACADQVWVVAYRPAWSKGLQLSKIGGHWAVGPVQQWWLDYEKLEAERPKHPAGDWKAWSEYLDASDKLYERFPACAHSQS